MSEFASLNSVSKFSRFGHFLALVLLLTFVSQYSQAAPQDSPIPFQGSPLNEQNVYWGQITGHSEVWLPSRQPLFGSQVHPLERMNEYRIDVQYVWSGRPCRVRYVIDSGSMSPGHWLGKNVIVQTNSSSGPTYVHWGIGGFSIWPTDSPPLDKLQAQFGSPSEARFWWPTEMSMRQRVFGWGLLWGLLALVAWLCWLQWRHDWEMRRDNEERELVTALQKKRTPMG